MVYIYIYMHLLMQQINVFFHGIYLQCGMNGWFALGFDMGFVSYLSLNKSALGIFPNSCQNMHGRAAREELHSELLVSKGIPC